MGEERVCTRGCCHSDRSSSAKEREGSGKLGLLISKCFGCCWEGGLPSDDHAVGVSKGRRGSRLVSEL